MTPLLVLAAVVIALAALLWWLLIYTEGVWLGQRVVTKLYDLYATRYDIIKGNDDVDEHILLAQPLMERIAPQVDPFVVDVACGTGRMTMALCQHARFEGVVLGVDLSVNMLNIAAQKVTDNHFDDYAMFAVMDARRLHIRSGAADVVTCMEALEFFPQQADALSEIARVLRPGGLLLTTLRQNAPTIPGVWTQSEMRQQLSEKGFEHITIVEWQHDYCLVWASRTGASEPIGAYPPHEALLCPECAHATLERLNDEALHCTSCQKQFMFTHGVLTLR